MTHSNNAKKNKQQKHPKKFFEQYLYNVRAPWSHVPNDTPAETEVELQENSLEMKRRFRYIAQRLRDNYT